MLVFARLGCPEFAIPYDITKISSLADELETEWQRTRLILENATKDSTDQQRRRTRSTLLKYIREKISEIGPGDKTPEFKLSTKQRLS